MTIGTFQLLNLTPSQIQPNDTSADLGTFDHLHFVQSVVRVFNDCDSWLRALGNPLCRLAHLYWILLVLFSFLFLFDSHNS